MNEWLHSPYIQQEIGSLVNGEITGLTGVFGVVVAAAISIVSGAIGGILFVGKSSNDSKLAAIIGSLFGPAAVIPATVIILVVMNFHHSYGHLEVTIEAGQIANDILVCPYDNFRDGLDAADCLTLADLDLESDRVDVSDGLIVARLN